MTKEDLFEMASLNYKMRLASGRLIGDSHLMFYRFPMELSHSDIKANVIVKAGAIKEIEIVHNDGSVQTVRID